MQVTENESRNRAGNTRAFDSPLTLRALLTVLAIILTPITSAGVAAFFNIHTHQTKMHDSWVEKNASVQIQLDSLKRELTLVTTLLKNPNARPDAFTATMWREGEKRLKEWFTDQLTIKEGRLRDDMPPLPYRRRMGAAEAWILRQDPSYAIPLE